MISTNRGRSCNRPPGCSNFNQPDRSGAALQEQAHCTINSPESIGTRVRLGLDAATAGTERFDPFKGGRLAASVGLSVGRTLGEHRHALREAAPDPQTAPIKRTARRLSTSEHSDEARSAWRSAIDRVCAWRHAVEPTEAPGRGRCGRIRRTQMTSSHVHAIRWGWSDSTPNKPKSLARDVDRGGGHRTWALPRHAGSSDGPCDWRHSPAAFRTEPLRHYLLHTAAARREHSSGSPHRPNSRHACRLTDPINPSAGRGRLRCVLG